jgi:hypothetical protein
MIRAKEESFGLGKSRYSGTLALSIGSWIRKGSGTASQNFVAGTRPFKKVP